MSIKSESAVDSIERAEVTDQIVQNPYLIKIASLHFATHVTNKRGKEYLLMLHRGLAEMRKTEVSDDIVASRLAEPQRASQVNQRREIPQLLRFWRQVVPEMATMLASYCLTEPERIWQDAREQDRSNTGQPAGQDGDAAAGACRLVD